MGITTKEAVEQLIKALKEDPEYYYSWQANIAMSFQDEYSKRFKGQTLYPEGETPAIIAEIANEAAKNFLNLLCK